MDPFTGQIGLFAGGSIPDGWAVCDGELVSIATHSALYSIIGTIYGGDGRTTFALPNFEGTVPIGTGCAADSTRLYKVGDKVGANTHTLDVTEIPSHTHMPAASTKAGTADSPLNAVCADDSNDEFKLYGKQAAAKVSMLPTTSTGGSKAHNIMQPSLAVVYCICVSGEYPS